MKLIFPEVSETEMSKRLNFIHKFQFRHVT